jgi:predicted outer membrane repeat protein
MYSKIIGLLMLLVASLTLQAQTVTIYRAGTAISPSYSSIKTAVAAALDHDSLVLSADTFREQNIVIDKSLSITGSSLLGDPSLIDAGLSTDSSAIIFTNPNFPSTTNTLLIQGLNITNGHANNGFDAGGGAIYAGKGTSLIIGDFCTLFNNRASDSSATFSGSRNGGAIYAEGDVSLKGNSIVEGNFAVNGGGIYTTKKLELSTVCIVRKNVATEKGGGIYSLGESYFLDYTELSGNKAKMGAGCYSENAIVLIKNNTKVSTNQSKVQGGAFYLKNVFFEMTDNAAIVLNCTDTNCAAAVYCTGNNEVNIKSGQIINNRSTNSSFTGRGMALYNDSLTGTSSIITINNARIFNPKSDNRRYNEVYNAQAISAFISDSSWWGESDTTGLIYNTPTATVALRSWIVCEWSLNSGLPIGLAATFPVEAQFKLFTGAAIPSGMFSMLEGYFLADSGKFIPYVAKINSANIVRSIYNAPITTGGDQIMAMVDADSFKQSVYVIGLGIAPSKSLVHGISVFPNPATNYLSLRSTLLNHKPTQLTITDMLGKRVLSQELQFTQQEITLPINLGPGAYIVRLVQDHQGICTQKITVQ